MKKVYVKPCIYMENFELSTHIANCKFSYTAQEENGCYATGSMPGAPDIDIQIFGSGTEGCLVVEDATSCQFVQADNAALFVS